jgi:hypothetical protein
VPAANDRPAHKIIITTNLNVTTILSSRPQPYRNLRADPVGTSFFARLEFVTGRGKIAKLFK